MTFRLAILADDLTGALDTAEPFARAGASVMVATSVEAASSLPFADCDVIAVNVDSRRLAPSAAADAMRNAWSRIADWAPDCLFKKIDSRMKGNIGVELKALTAASGRARAVVVPAIPAIGRFTTAGVVTGFGVERPVEIASLPGWRAAWDVRDCSSEEDMAVIAAGLLSSPDRTLAVGASGLAEALALALYGIGPPAPVHTAGDERMLMVIGSRDPITLGQIDALRQSDLAPMIVRGGETLAHAATPADLILLPPQEADRAPEAVARLLAVRALDIARREGISTLLLSGGDTAAAFVSLAGIDLLRPSGLLAQGMPIVRGGADGKAYTLVTKSGGFGDPDTLVTAIRNWRALGRPQRG